jgi:hypothetical protein
MTTDHERRTREYANQALRELSAQQAALDALTKADIGLGNVDNTSDANKPVSTAQQTALDTKANAAQPAFTTPTLLNSWVHYGAPFNVPGHFKDTLGIVHLRGLVKNGGAGTTIFTLPAGSRPVGTELFAVIANGAFGEARVDSSGSVLHVSGSNAYFSLDGITFRAA